MSFVTSGIRIHAGVHKDSSFAVYIKPGDAKFLYIEKGISIRVSPTAYSGSSVFGYNNGRRVAERMAGQKQVVAYVMDNRVHVSYPAEGHRFEGYYESSAGDAVATGNDIMLDSIGIPSNPSLCVAQNDAGGSVA
jgi:hypothetical protein